MKMKLTEPLPKTELCCGLKPKRTFYQTGFRDDEGRFQLQCKKCGKKVCLENNTRGTSNIELEAIKTWNSLLQMR